jgi:hypothetical protein
LPVQVKETRTPAVLIDPSKYIKAVLSCTL